MGISYEALRSEIVGEDACLISELWNASEVWKYFEKQN